MNRFNQLYDIFIMKAKGEDNSLFVNLGFRSAFLLIFLLQSCDVSRGNTALYISV